MVPEIDFLPAAYHQTRRRRRKASYRRVALVGFGILVILGTLRQWQVQAQMEATRDRLMAHAQDTLTQLGTPDALRQQILDLDARADLVSYLRVRVAPSRLLLAVTRTLPQHVSLTDLHAAHETTGLPPVAVGSPSKSSKSPPAAPKLAEADDLARRREQDAMTRLTVSLSGLAPSDVAISHYLADLQATGLFDEVRLLYSEQFSYRDNPLRKFGVKLRVRRPSMESASGQGYSPENSSAGDAIALLDIWRKELQ